MQLQNEKNRMCKSEYVKGTSSMMEIPAAINGTEVVRLEEIKEESFNGMRTSKSRSTMNGQQRDFMRTFNSQMRSSSLFKTHIELQEKRFFHGIATFVTSPTGKYCHMI